MKGTMLTLLAAVAVLLGAASSQTAAGTKPTAAGFQPGTWIGTGTLAGSADDGKIAGSFNGPIRFELTVDERLKASGHGAWTMRRFESRAREATVKGWAALAFAGRSTTVRLSGTRYVIGEVAGELPQHVRFEHKFDARLRITAAGACRITGTTRVASSTLNWVAHRAAPGCA